jgi:glutathione S-transferase
MRCAHAWRSQSAASAISPFVRQFAQVDAAWFEGQPWPRLRAWLAARLDSPVFARAMDKYPPWRADQPGVDFPPKR